ncbi:MAG: dihydrofolate reductase [Deltaproteobacteria bacterium]|nr:MAG: dihydrofolate reductase [Deltaproteobacteria bacterium]
MKVTLLMALTVDGKIARHPGQFIDWSGRADKKLFVRMTQKAGVLIMGSRTYDTIGHPLPGRKNIILTRNKTRQSDNENLIFTDRSPAAIIDELQADGYRQVILTGGSTINTLFARDHLIDEIVVTITPKIFGTGMGIFSEELDLSLKLKSVGRVDDELVILTYQVVAP